ncbi:MAG TPA: penicillin-binding transpeptidase domain-containing protein, partial [Solirubrobacterales bacterium]|nr:penicillin-binding transpeptidase domain-containing protein [Solirubrobacterales bacterium]
NDYTIDWGPIALDTALTNSVNTWFAQLGEDVGQDTMFETMQEFGFGSTPPIDLPNEGDESEVARSGLYTPEGGLLTKDDPVDVARVAIGQERLLVTPLQMAMVASAVANGGELMKPQIWSRVVDPDGRVVESLDPSEYSEPIDGDTAADLTTAMEGVVEEGTGTNAEIPGVPVAGKTGTAETPFNDSCGGGSDENQAWFIGFAPADDPQIAIAATVECTTQFGGDVAAPIFREVAEAILNSE